MKQDDRQHEPRQPERTCESVSSENLPSESLAQLTDAETQARYREEYLAQLRRRACPGCGEDAFFD